MKSVLYIYGIFCTVGSGSENDSPKLPLPLWTGSGPLPNTRCFGPTRVHTYYGILIGSAGLAQLMVPTSSALPWVMLCMVAFPDIQRRCHEELDQVTSPHRCCHLPNKVENIHHTPVFENTYFTFFSDFRKNVTFYFF